MYVNSDHSGDKETRRPRTGFLIYMNKVLVRWLSKNQLMIETYMFGAKFVAMKISMETLGGLRYNLRIMCLYMKIKCQLSIIHRDWILHCGRKSIQSVIMQFESQFQWDDQWWHGFIQVKILLIYWLKFYMGQSGVILWGIYCLIFNICISNWIQDSGGIVVLCIVVHIYTGCNLRQARG